MMRVSAQVSIYPLRQIELSGAIDEALAVFRSHGLQIKIGNMSTVLSGPVEEVFGSLKEAYQRTTQHGDAVMVVTLSNACPNSIPK
jgi:uncharacterized protein YqgV (UPF0045/DUF77 family)